MADGFLHVCKSCHKAAIRAKRLERIDHYRAYDRKRAKHPDRIKHAVEITRAWRAADSLRTAAHNAVARAVRSGRLIRATCERCGSPKTHAHHDDYKKKLSVLWLCAPCHKVRHKELHQAGVSP